MYIVAHVYGVAHAKLGSSRRFPCDFPNPSLRKLYNSSIQLGSVGTSAIDCLDCLASDTDHSSI